MNNIFLVMMFLFLSVSTVAQDHQHHQNQQGNRPEQMAETHKHPMGSSDCTDMEVWDYSFGLCMPLPMTNVPMSMAMVHGNAFLTGITSEGPKGRSTFAFPNMIMGDYGKSAGDRHYVDVNLMLTFEKWTFPKNGYPELLQIGEENEDHQPYIDAQHPHSSPIMGLTFSDTIRLDSGKNHLKIFFAPRGQATEGPVAFMHRQTGMVNPDAPLGHHIGQDVAHITSTVLGFSLGLNKTRLEVSTFNGTEPEPSKVDLPLGTPNSYAGRIIQELSNEWTVMASASEVNNPEPYDPDITKIRRYSGSVYSETKFESGWMLHNTFILGLINGYKRTGALQSLLNEFWLHSDSSSQFWGRIEYLQRTASQLAVTAANPTDPQWITAATLGYTYKLGTSNDTNFSVGSSVTKDLLPSDFRSAYGGDPWTGKIFLQTSGMKMWEINR